MSDTTPLTDLPHKISTTGLFAYRPKRLQRKAILRWGIGSITSKAQPGDQRVPAKRIRRLGAVLHDAELEDALVSVRLSETHVARAVCRDG